MLQHAQTKLGQRQNKTVGVFGIFIGILETYAIIKATTFPGKSVNISMPGLILHVLQQFGFVDTECVFDWHDQVSYWMYHKEENDTVVTMHCWAAAYIP